MNFIKLLLQNSRVHSISQKCIISKHYLHFSNFNNPAVQIMTFTFAWGTFKVNHVIWERFTNTLITTLVSNVRISKTRNARLLKALMKIAS